MRKSTLFAVAIVSLLSFASTTVMAQHAKFVLFGDPNPEAAEVSKERKAVHPLTAPYLHEDSFVTSDVRAWYIYHKFSRGTLGGDVQVAALQVRVALTDQLQFVAYRDGYVWHDNALTQSSDFMDLGAGLKWNFLQDWQNDFHAAVGAGYQFPMGSEDVLQDNEEARFWASVNKGFDKLHLGATINYLVNSQSENALGNADRFTWHLHADYYVCEWFSPVIELNGYHVTDEGTAVVPFHGVDVTNLGGGKSEDSVILGIGCELRPADNVGVRIAYEHPLSESIELFGYRWTASAVFSF